MKNRLVLSLGSNIEPKREYLVQAINLLNRAFCLEHVSSLYETNPVDDINQDKFLNICADYLTEVRDPFDVLKITKGIEKKIGRVKQAGRPKGPRIIDIDIIFFGYLELHSEELIIPHAAFLNRKFVLAPLLEILPANSFYIERYKLIECLDKCNDQIVNCIGEIDNWKIVKI